MWSFVQGEVPDCHQPSCLQEGAEKAYPSRLDRNDLANRKNEEIQKEQGEI